MNPLALLLSDTALPYLKDPRLNQSSVRAAAVAEQGVALRRLEIAPVVLARHRIVDIDPDAPWSAAVPPLPNSVQVLLIAHLRGIFPQTGKEQVSSDLNNLPEAGALSRRLTLFCRSIVDQFRPRTSLCSALPRGRAAWENSLAVYSPADNSFRPVFGQAERGVTPLFVFFATVSF